MIRRRPTKRRNDTRISVIANHRIRANQVRALNEYGEMVGVMSLQEAMDKARDIEKDVVLINESQDPPIVQIIDIAKYKYKQQQKQAEGRKKAKAQDTKEVRFTPFMSDGDFQSRLKKVIGFLEKGDKVRLSLQFKGRAITKKEFGYDMFHRVITATQEVGSVEIEPKMMGNKLMAQLMPAKNTNK